MHKSINTKAHLYIGTQNYNRAIRLLRNTLKKYASTTSYNTLAHTNRILGDLYSNYIQIQNRDSSVYFYKKAIEIIEKTDYDYIKPHLYINYADVLIQSEKYKKAHYYLNLAEKIALETSSNFRLYYINVNLGVYYFDTKDFPKAIEKFQKALQEYGAYANGDQKALTYWLLADAYYYINQFE